MSEKFACTSLAELPGIANIILSKEKKKIAFFGSMGSGKTTFIKELCKALEIEQTVTSPTFTLMNHYSNNNINVYHFDLYRIKKTDEIFELGYEEYFFSDDYVFIEWPEKAENLIPENFSKISIEVTDDNKRIFIWED